MSYTATVVITTKNRKDELAVAVRSALEQRAKPQVLVIDDGSTDGTSEMLAVNFPSVVVHRNETSRGYIVQRNRGAELASGEIIFSIDDDAAFSTPYVVEQTLAAFDNPRVGAVAIPFINVKQDQVVQQKAPDTKGVYVLASYIGTAHALRRELFLQLGGYRAHLFHQGEESDFCIRLLDAGYVVAAGTADPIHHFESPRRSNQRMAIYGRRNDILFGWHNVPLAGLPLRWIRATAGGVLHGVKTGSPLWNLRGLINGYAACLKFARHRKPVSAKTYAMFRRLQKEGPLPIGEILR